MIGCPVELSFKGERNYLHGTDVYECGISCIRHRWPEIDGRCRFTFHRMTAQPLSVIVDRFAAGRARPDKCIADIHITGGANEASVWFVERDGKIAGRYAYDEGAVVRNCVIADNKISRTGSTDNSTIEFIIAMTKRLHNKIAAPQQGRWLFTRLDLKRLLQPQDSRELTIALKSEPRTKVTRSEIFAGNQSIGSIFFSVGRT